MEKIEKVDSSEVLDKDNKQNPKEKLKTVLKPKKISSNSKEKKVRRKTKKRLTQAEIKKYPMNELDHVISKIKANEVKYTVISVIFMLMVFFVAAYIVFSSVQKHVNHNTLRDGNLVIEFKENENGLGDIIDLVNVKTYSNVKDVFNVYEVKITNDSSNDVNYQIFIQDDVDMIKIDNCDDIFLDRSFLRYSINGGNEKKLTIDEENSIIFGSLVAKKSIVYKIKVWVNDEYLDSPHYHGKIVVKQIDIKKDSSIKKQKEES